MNQLDLLKSARGMRRHAESIKPEAEWIAETRSTLLMQVKNSSPRKEQKRSNVADMVTVLKPIMSLGWMRRPSAIIVAVLLVIFGGSWFSVSAAEQALPGDMLYSVKLASEQARLVMAKDATEKIKLKTEFTERRVDELNKVKAANLDDKSSRVVQAAEVLKRDLHTIKVQLDEVKQTSTPESVKDTVKLVDQKTLQVANDLQNSKQDLSVEDQAKITEAQAAASETAVKALEVLAETHAQAQDVVSQEDVADAVKGHAEQVKAMTASLTILDLQITTSTSATTTTLLTAPTSTAKATTTVKVPVSSTSTPAVGSSTSTTPTVAEQALQAQTAADEAGQLASEQKLDEAVAKMKQATELAVTAQKTAATEALTEQVANEPSQTTEGDMNGTDGQTDESAPPTTEETNDNQLQTTTTTTITNP